MDYNQNQNEEGWTRADTSVNGQDNYDSQSAQNPPNGQTYPSQSTYDTPGRAYAIASMVLGICSIIFCLCWGIIGIACSIVALVMHSYAVKEDGYESSYAKAGKICAIIGMALGIVNLLFTIVVFILRFLSFNGLKTLEYIGIL